jgi:hypothetical protein
MKSLSLLNVKGVTGQFQLAPITIVTGSNSVGKTAILNAVTLALLGHIPALGKRPSSTFQLSSGPRMMVDADGTRFMWDQKKTTVTFTEPEGWTAAPETMLDIHGLFSATKDQRMLAIMRACQLPESLTTKRVLTEVQVVCPSFPFPATTGMILDDIDSLTKAGKTFLSTTKARLEEYVAAGKRHADEMAALATEPKSLLPAIGEAHEHLGKVRQKIKECSNSEGERARLVRQMEGMKIPDLAALKEERVNVETTIKGLNGKSADDIATEMADVLRPLEERLSILKGRWQILRERIEKLNGTSECPTCGHPVTEHDLEEAEREITENLEAADALAKEIRTKRDGYNLLRTAANVDANRRQAMEKRIATIDALIESIPQAEASKKALEEAITKIPSAEERPALEAEQASIVAGIKVLDDRQRIWEAAQALQTAAEAAARQRVEFETRIEQVKLANSLIGDFRAEVLKVASNSLLSVANRVIQPVLGGELTLEEGDFLFKGPRGNACIDTLSGSERMVVFAGLQIALSAAHQPKIVLMDELGVVDDKRKELLLTRVSALIADGTISQFIGVDINPPETLPADSTLISL